MWNKEHLKETIHSKMEGYHLVIASNRQPFSHKVKGGKVVCQREPGGLVTALNPVMQAAQGTWVAAGTSEHDRKNVDAGFKVMVPQENPSYALRRIFFPKSEWDQYYFGYCNEGLWPLCHIAYTRPMFLDSDWKAYESANRKFAAAILEEIGDRKAFVWVHDFHLVLVAKYLKEAGASNIITSIFWHIPWPNPEVFRICPQKKEILEALLAYDLVGFQIRYHCDNFLACVDREIESRIDREKIAVQYQSHETLVRAFPISVDYEAVSSQVQNGEADARIAEVLSDVDIQGKKLLVGVDRIDYTKGIPERLRAIDRFLEKHPNYRQKMVFFQVGQISRIHVPRYKQLNDEINALVEEINWKHSEGAWTPIVFSRTAMTYPEILALLRAADCCIVSSLHDGMNLVAKEFVSARADLKGVLLLSCFTGASRELDDALSINPFDTESFADSILQALEMPEEEQKKRMAKMRDTVRQQNIFRWAGKVMSQLLKFDFQES